MPYLFAVDDATATGVGGVLLLLVGAMGAWVLKIKESHNALVIKLEELRQGGAAKTGETQLKQDEAVAKARAAEFEQFQTQLRTAAHWIDQLEDRDDEKSKTIERLLRGEAECRSREAALRERIAWLELNPGQSPPKRPGDSGVLLRPSQPQSPGHEGADV